MRFRWLIAPIGLAAFLLLGWLTVEASAPRIEAALRAQSTAALRAAGYDWASTSISGRHVTLSGAAPSEAARDAALQIVRASAGGEGWLIGGVASVSDQTTLPPLRSPYTWMAQRLRDGGARGILLSGAVPSLAARVALLAEARAAFPERVVDRMEIARGAPEGDWLGAARRGLAQIALIDNSEVQFSDRIVVLRGETDSAETATRVRTAMAAVGAPFQVRTDVMVLLPLAPPPAMGQAGASLVPATPQADPPPTPASQATQNLRTPEGCQAALDQRLANRRIEFDSASPVIRRTSLPVLDDLAQVIRQCGPLRVAVSGHTDNTGRAETNLQLSRDRARAVADYLVSRGIESRRLVWVGFGASRPVAENTTEDGKARNRRIEFRVQR
jgi:OmpA-OmpF porin, OOP family